MLHRTREDWERHKQSIKNKFPVWMSIVWEDEPRDFPCVCSAIAIGPPPYTISCHVFTPEMARDLLEVAEPQVEELREYQLVA